MRACAAWSPQRTRLPVDEATTLPGAVYHDEEFFSLEKNNVFQSSWVAAAELVDLQNPGDLVPATIGGAPVVLANDNGTIRAFHNVCSHRGAQLINAKCSKRRTILCPYHRWGYALDGRLVGTPSFDDDPDGKKVPEQLREKFRTHHVKDFDKSKMGLKPINVECALGLAFVNLSGEAPPLAEWFGDLLPQFADFEKSLGAGKLHATHRKTYNIDANWKVRQVRVRVRVTGRRAHARRARARAPPPPSPPLRLTARLAPRPLCRSRVVRRSRQVLVENYLEYYHLPAVHPDLCKVSGVDEHRRNQGRGMYMGFATDPLTKGGTPLDPGRLPVFPTIAAHRTETAYHLSLFPNTFFSLYPDAFFRVVLSPQSAGRTVEHATLMTHAGALSVPDADAKMVHTASALSPIPASPSPQAGGAPPVRPPGPVSYTHLTLPTICSV
eukprot:7380123-Prymnesium_polylepis.1